MSNLADVRPPRVFISHAGPDSGSAVRLARDLDDHGIRTFVDKRDIPPSYSVILAIHHEIEESDYFLLLWSRHCAGRRNVEDEFAAALAREMKTLRTFLFIVRLDRSYPPGLLAPRRYLDVFAGWNEVLTQLVDVWTRDRNVGLPVLPAPHPVTANGSTPIVVYVRNRALSVAHVLTVPSRCSGREFDRVVRGGLGLPDRATEFDGRTGVRFHYEFRYAGVALPVQTTLEAAGVVDCSTIDLEVRLEPFGPDGPLEGGSVMRGSDDPLPMRPAIRNLVRKAFAHLMPTPVAAAGPRPFGTNWSAGRSSGD